MQLFARVMAVLLALVLTLAWGCDGDAPATGAGPVTIKLATTTSTENSGLLDVLLPAFRKASGIEVQVLSMGTGKALRTAENGDCDVVLVHAPAAEQAFVDAGFGVDRRAVMHNDFVILGPPEDPAEVKAAPSVADALMRIAAQQAVFCSRGDDSGTHKKERGLWQAAQLTPGGSWYQETGQGMGATLTIANQKRGYVLADRGTYLTFRDKIELVVLGEGDATLMNPYSIIAVNPDRHQHVRHEAVRQFIDWLTGPEAQQLIGRFRKGGEQLFHPDAVTP